MHAPSLPVPSVSPSKDRMMLVDWENYPSMERVSAPYLCLGGVLVEPHNHSKRDTPEGGYGIQPRAIGYELLHITDGNVDARIPIMLPENASTHWPLWSADGKRFAFVNITSKSVELWVGNS